MVIVFLVASFHAFAIAVAFAQIDRVRKFDTRYWALIRDLDVNAVVLFGFFLQSPMNPFEKTIRVQSFSRAIQSKRNQQEAETGSIPATAYSQRGKAIANHFVGLAAPESGPRAFPGAPPQIPHATFMRTDCLSCHGDTSYRGLRTTHPWRRNCQQCETHSGSTRSKALRMVFG